MLNKFVKTFLFTLSVTITPLLKAQEISDSVANSAPVKKVSFDEHGAVIRGDLSQKQIALVFTGDEFADGGAVIRKVLDNHKVKASFFLTGKFYSSRSFKTLIAELLRDGHYLGAHSDKHLLYADWTKRDSLLVTQTEFKLDLQNNYRRMAEFGIKKEDAQYFIPPYEWYNSKISQWTKELNLQLINFSPGTLSAADYTYPDMGTRYRSSDEIYQSILKYEAQEQHGLNGFILLIHIGTDPRRKDKFYNKLTILLNELESKGYNFVRINQLLK